MIKVGIAGLGRQGMLHFTSCLHVEGVRVVAVSDKSERALAKARSCGVSSVYKDYNEIFSAHPNRCGDHIYAEYSAPAAGAVGIARRRALGR